MSIMRFSENVEKPHNIPVGSLVEVKSNGLRLWVHSYSRDCDGTPLYNLTAHEDAFNIEVSDALFPDDFKEKVKESAIGYMQSLDYSHQDAMSLAQMLLSRKLGEDSAKIISNYADEESLTVIKKVQPNER